MPLTPARVGSRTSICTLPCGGCFTRLGLAPLHHFRELSHTTLHLPSAYGLLPQPLHTGLWLRLPPWRSSVSGARARLWFLVQPDSVRDGGGTNIAARSTASGS